MLLSQMPIHIEGYQYPPFRRDCDKNSWGKMIFIREGLIAKRVYAYEDSTPKLYTWKSQCLKGNGV